MGVMQHLRCFSAAMSLLVLMAATASAGTTLRFDSERIRLEIRGDTLRVEGLYRFIDQSEGGRLSLFYPYPADSLLGRAWMQSLDFRHGEGEAWSPLDFDETGQGGGARWHLAQARGERFEIRAVYRQLLRREYARYIVTSTKAWKRPLRHARFELSLPPGAVLTRSSYPFVRGEQELWIYETEQFLPDVDIVVEWSIEPGSRSADPREAEKNKQ